MANYFISKINKINVNETAQPAKFLSIVYCVPLVYSNYYHKIFRKKGTSTIESNKNRVPLKIFCSPNMKNASENSA